MTQRRDTDELLRAYFGERAPELPDRVFDAVRRDIHRSRQRLVLGPWREPDARMLARVLPIAATIALLLSLWILNIPLLGGGPTRTPGPTPIVFRSSLYGYSVNVPAGWNTTSATTRWDGESAPFQGLNVDQISGSHLLVLGYAGPFAGELAAFVQDRIAAAARDHSDTCPTHALQSNESITIGGQPSVLLGLDCGARIDQAITVRDGIGYAFTIRDLGFATALDPAELGRVRSMLDSLIFPVAPIRSP